MMIFGYCSASLAAALVLAVAGAAWSDLRSGVIFVFVMWFAILLFTFAPAFLAITYAADHGIRSPWYYVLTGVGAALFPLLFAGLILFWMPGGRYALTILVEHLGS
jgi:hypothetical protein